MDHKLMQAVLQTIAANGGFDNDDALMRRLSRETGIGGLDTRFQDFLGGFNRTQQGSAVPANTDMQGVTFITRPNLNLSYDNVMAVRQLSVLANKLPNSYGRIIRRMLWPDSYLPNNHDTAADNAIFNNKHAFIPILSNALTSMSGWPDLTLHAYSSSEGLAKEVWMMNDTIAEINGRFSLDCTFENTLGDPISLLLFAWILYIGGVYLGTKIVPAGYSVAQNEIDYMSRIYRFSLDWSGRYVQKWAACGAAFPTGLSMGTAFNYSRDTPYNENNKAIQATFECTVAEYNDPITLWEFNKLVIMFNPDMGEDRRRSRMVKVSAAEHSTYSKQDTRDRNLVDERKVLNYKGYPFINMTNDNELEWWVEKEIYEEVVKGKLSPDYTGQTSLPIQEPNPVEAPARNNSWNERNSI